jgi:DNA-binding CsgD family transcriptional regulator
VPSLSKSAPRALQARERENQVLQLRVRGASFPEIASLLGFSHKGTAYNAFRRAIARHQVEDAAALEEERSLMLARCDELLRALWPYAIGRPPGSAARGEPAYKAVNAAAKILAFQAQILGLMPQPSDAPPPPAGDIEFSLSIFDERPLQPAEDEADVGTTIDGTARTVQ